MKPVEALYEAVLMAAASSRRQCPGEVISHLPRETRAALEQLTSEDALNLRADFLPYYKDRPKHR